MTHRSVSSAVIIAVVSWGMVLVAGDVGAAANEEWTWAKLEPIVSTRIDVALRDDGEQPRNRPTAIVEAVDEAVRSTLPRVRLQAEGVPTGEALLAHPRSARLMRASVSTALARHGMSCADCAPASAPIRDVTLVELLPYALASTYVGVDDLDPDPEHGGFHLCAGGILAAKLPDEDLGSVSLAAMMALLERDGGTELFRSRVVQARRLGPKVDVVTADDLRRALLSKTVTDLYRGGLATDAAFISSLRRALAVESDAAGLRCTDCVPRDPLEGTWSLKWRRSAWQPRLLAGAMSLRREGDAWKGAAWADTIDNGEAFFDVRDVTVAGDRVAFTLHETWMDMRFEGRLVGSTLEGSAAWSDSKGGAQRDALVAVRRDVVRLDDASDRRFEAASDPASVGLDADALDRVILLAEESGSDALVVVSDGKLACDRSFGSVRAARDLGSITKGISSLAVGFLVQEGMIGDLDARLSRWYPEFGKDERRGITLRQILAHSSGLDPGAIQALNEAPDQLAHARAATLVDVPGAKYAYNNRAIQLLSGIVEAEAAQPVAAFLRARLFTRLGMKSADWAADGAGHTPTYDGLSLDAMDLAVLGEALADGGEWEGTQVIPATWVANLLEPASQGRATLGWFQIPTSEEDARPMGFMHSGDGGQQLIVYPEARLVFVRLAGVDTWKSDESWPAFRWLGTLSKNLAQAKTARGLTRP